MQCLIQKSVRTQRASKMDIPVRATLWYARSQRWGFHLYPCSSARQTWIDPNRSLREGKWERMSCCKLVL